MCYTTQFNLQSQKSHLYFYFYLVLFRLLLNDGKTTSIIRLSTSCSLFCFPILFFVCFLCWFLLFIIGALTIQCLTIFHLDRLSLSGMIVSVTLVSVFNVRLIGFDHRFLSAIFCSWIGFFVWNSIPPTTNLMKSINEFKTFFYNFFAPKEPAEI